MIGSLIVRGRSVRILAIWSFTSLRARSILAPIENWTVVPDEPSERLDRMCQMPFTPAMASSTLRVTWVSSSPGAAPDWVIETWTIGMSMLGNRVIGSDMKLTMPRISNTRNVTIAGIGDRIDHAEMFSLIARLPGAARYPQP